VLFRGVAVRILAGFFCVPFRLLKTLRSKIGSRVLLSEGERSLLLGGVSPTRDRPFLSSFCVGEDFRWADPEWGSEGCCLSSKKKIYLRSLTDLGGNYI